MSESTKNLLFTILGGVLAFLSTMLVEQCYRPAQIRTQVQSELFRATYDRRIDAYQTLTELFSDVYWLERELAAAMPETRRERRLALIEKVQRQLTRAIPIIDKTVHQRALEALNSYIQQSENFTAETRRKWVNEHVDPLVNAIRRDLKLDEVNRGVAEKIFQIGP